MRLTDEQIGAELRALRPTPSESFAAMLDRRAGAGFPAVKQAARDRSLTWGRLGLVLAPLTAIAVVALIVANNTGKSASDLTVPAQAPNATGPGLSGGSGAAGTTAQPDLF
jgi:hypothetical protein